MKIKPGLGLDNTYFGMNREQVREINGEPEQVAPDDDGDGESVVAWYYWKKGISFHFGSRLNWRLSSIEVDNPIAEIKGHALIGCSLEELFSILNSEGVKWAEPKKDYEPVFVEEWEADFWIEEDFVASIHYGPLFDENGDKIWPSLEG